jgi:mRNA interferase RelE/StbE
MTWRLQYTARATKDLRKMERETARRIIRSLSTIREDPYHHIKKLKGVKPEHPVYTFRIGLSYRALLSIHNDVLVILVLEIEDRNSSYRDF